MWRFDAIRGNSAALVVPSCSESSTSPAAAPRRTTLLVRANGLRVMQLRYERGDGKETPRAGRSPRAGRATQPIHLLRYALAP